jgi:hypothetical protein
MTTTRPLDQKTTEIVERHRTALENGTRFMWYHQSYASADRMSGGGPINSRKYAEVLMCLSRYALMGDKQAQHVSKIVSKINLYGTPSQVLAGIGQAMFEIMVGGFDDVIGRTGPEAGRYSDHQHASTLRDALYLDMLLTEIEMATHMSASVPGIGWVDAILIREQQEQSYFAIHAAYFPHVAAYWEARNS